MEIDALDARILQYLQRNCSVSIEALSEKVGLSRNAVWRRIRALEDHGYIKNKVAIVDPIKSDLNYLYLYKSKPACMTKNGEIALQRLSQIYRRYFLPTE